MRWFVKNKLILRDFVKWPIFHQISPIMRENSYFPLNAWKRKKSGWWRDWVPPGGLKYEISCTQLFHIQPDEKNNTNMTYLFSCTIKIYSLSLTSLITRFSSWIFLSLFLYSSREKSLMRMFLTFLCFLINNWRGEFIIAYFSFREINLTHIRTRN